MRRRIRPSCWSSSRDRSRLSTIRRLRGEGVVMDSEAPRVLLIDDEALAREVYGDHLRQSGCEVDTASGFAEGVEAFQPGVHQVVVTDLLLQDGDGLQLLSEVKL